MKVIAIGILLILIVSGCDTANQDAVNKTEIPPVQSSEAVAPTRQIQELGIVSPKLKINKEQQKYLDETIPPDTRKILESATKFELVAEVNVEWTTETEMMSLNPNRRVLIESDELKREILEAFYWDAAREVGGANCWEPRHGMIATIDNKTVEIDICFECAKFNLRSGSDNYWGTIERDKRKSEELFNKLVEDKGVEIVRQGQ